MRKTKLAISLLLVVVMIAASVATLVACGGDGDRIELLVWAPSAAQTFYKTWADKWAKDYKDSQGRQFKIKLGIQSEGDAKTELLKAPADAADLFAFADDQLDELVTAGAISQVGDPTKEGSVAKDVATRNSAGSVEAATKNGKLYAYPMQADNGYFLYYNSKVLTEADVANWDTLWAKLATLNAGKTGADVMKVNFAQGTAWYQASWFFSFGGAVSKTSETFSTDEVGLKALKAAHNFSTHGEFIFDSDPNDAIEGLGDGSIVASVAGGWIYPDITQGEGVELKMTVLPSITDPDDSTKTVPMYSFLGSKLFGVNSMRDYQEASHALANYLTSEEVQIAKAKDLQAGPSNIKAADSEEAKALPTVQALAKQSAHSVPQINLPSGFWDALPTAINAVKADSSNADLGTYYDGETPIEAKLKELLADLHNDMNLDSADAE